MQYIRAFSESWAHNVTLSSRPSMKHISFKSLIVYGLMLNYFLIFTLISFRYGNCIFSDEPNCN